LRVLEEVFGRGKEGGNSEIHRSTGDAIYQSSEAAEEVRECCRR
jgi:hypothetical protein